MVHTLSEDLLERFAALPLLSQYDAYQRLMDYWAEVMQDDVYLIAADGCVGAAKPRGVIDDKEREIKETPDPIIGRKKYKMDLIPPALIVSRYFANEQAAIETLEATRDADARDLEEFVEENSGEEGLLEEAKNDKGFVTKGGIKDWLQVITDEPESDDERAALTCCLKLIEAEAEANKAVKDAQAELDVAVLDRYRTLTEDEITSLTVEDKWFAAIQSAIEGEAQRLIQGLAPRVKVLEERYANTMQELEEDVDELSARVEEHLRKVGLVWV